MDVAHVRLVDAFDGSLVCDSICAVFTGEAMYVPLRVAKRAGGRVVRVQTTDRPPSFPLEVHPDYDSVQVTLEQGQPESLRTDEEAVAAARRGDYCMLTHGVGVVVNSLVPEVIHHWADGRVLSLAVFRTRDGIVPNTLLGHDIPIDDDDAALRLLYDAMSSEWAPDRHDIGGAEVAGYTVRRGVCVVTFCMPRVVLSR